MIVLNLSCNDGHRFEGWFASREAFDDQCARGLVSCALCQSPQIAALPSGPRVLRNAAEPVAALTANVAPAAEQAAREVFKLLAAAARQAENVGARFAEEARRIHYREAPERAIRGQASREETLELLEEGIPVLPAPVPHESETH